MLSQRETVNMAEKTIISNGMIATLRVARKPYNCCVCQGGIHPSEKYWEIQYAGSGLHGTKYPDRVCVMCRSKKMSRRANHADI